MTRCRLGVLAALSLASVGCTRAPRAVAPDARPSARASLGVALSHAMAPGLDRALAEHTFPGAYAAVGDARGVLAERAVGRLDDSASPPTSADTLWDLASLTKVVGTTTAAMRLYDDGRLDLDAPVQRYLPEFTGADKDRVTVRHLLTHSAGLTRWRAYYQSAATPEALFALIAADPLEAPPGARVVYSDPGMILLGRVIERVAGRTLDRYLADEVFGPLGMSSTGFNPAPSLLPRIAPTEFDRAWRGRHLRGEVHDENAFALGGVSGNAGLFSSGRDLSRFSQMLLSEGTLDGRRVVSPGAVALFTTVQDPRRSGRALGWENPEGESSAGSHLSARAFGHTGFTGTSLWIDPSRGMFMFLLSNRVNPTRDNPRLGPVRATFANAVTEAWDRFTR